ncbi:outer membrane protein assembly factor BamC [Haliea sp. E1-2-M8]|uniref:outer membrane protein assembly factor BamC n=1 Tax=Haliea sp. E1-2-M8 TaxID=3064706 RepID=UPI002721CD99|nr:outer membrane protein assembly factor BamC [Haliea sp. E1-2-M8]MDO8861466.1 outer membrane protein assembly factor BamC [Haliea sp. E1-2-M8]
MTDHIGLITRALLATTLVLSASACSYLFGEEGMFPDTSEDYKQAQEHEPIQLPEGKDASAMEEIYPIPPVSDNLVMDGEFEVPRPTPLVAGAGEDVVRIQSLGDESWALIAIAPGQLWPQVRSFLAAAGIPVARVDAQAGLIDSDWLELEGQAMSSRFRFRIEQGVQRGSSELHVLQMDQAGDGITWPQESDNIEQEGEMLRAVAQFIANSADSAPVSMIADRAMSAEGKISLEEADAGYTFIQVGLPFTRAWAALAKALEDSRFEITDRDRSGGTYYVRYLGEEAEEEKGWFSRLFSGGDEDSLADREFLVTVAAAGEQAVTVRLAPAGTATGPLEKRDEQELLALIKGNIN